MAGEHARPEASGQENIASIEKRRLRKHHLLLKATELSIVICLVLFTLALNVSRAVRAEYNHDEDQFITSARLLLDEGLLPYRDYPYFHTP